MGLPFARGQARGVSLRVPELVDAVARTRARSLLLAQVQAYGR